MEELKPGTFVIMVKNEDNSFSPIGMSKNQAILMNSFLSKLSEEKPLIIKESMKYEKRIN